jgi:hypothetical protein
MLRMLLLAYSAQGIAQGAFTLFNAVFVPKYRRNHIFEHGEQAQVPYWHRI